MEQLGALSLLPIVITLILSLLTRNVVVGLFVGILSGISLLHGINIFDNVALLVKDHLAVQLTSSYNAGVLVLLVFIGGFVALMEKSGGGSAFANSVIHWITTKFKSQILAWLGGVVIFFSDLGTPLIVGPVFRPLFDKLKISREKLAFILDSTSSPVAILIPFIGWGVYIMGLIHKEFSAINLQTSDFDAFISAIPFQFYAFLAIFIVPLVAFKKLDFGAMADAEKRAERGESKEAAHVETLVAFTHKNAKPAFVWAPLLVMAVIFISMLAPLGFPFEKVSGSMFRAVLSTAYFFAAMTLILLMSFYGVRKFSEGIHVYLTGMGKMMQVAIILILAWTLSSLGKEIGTAAYIAEIAQNGFPAWLLPATAFLFSAVISFATGSSWGTFAIMMPLVIPTSFAIDAPLFVGIGAVLSGGLFGDHCSPISETTILSSTGAGCDQFEHFRTQLPYAILNGVISLLCFIFAGLFTSMIILPIAIVMQIIAVFALSKWYANKTV
jgi:Na+/H+ antiporter NhaC